MTFKRTFATLTLIGASMAATLAAAGDLAPKIETLPSGVTVTHLKRGTGPTPRADNVVRVNYRGTLANGIEFDSSYKRNTPISFSLQAVIPCWTQGVQQMKVGGTAKLVCPPSTAYGPNGVPGVIPPNSVLTFEVELLAIEK